MVEAVRLHVASERRASSLSLLEGPHLLAEAVAGSCSILRVFAEPDDRGAAVLAAEAGAEFLPVSAEVLSRLAPTQHPRGPIAVFRIPPPPVVDAFGALVLWRVSDPGNVGTIIRTAAAFGLGVVVVAGADPWAPKALRAGAGAHFRTKVETKPDLTAAHLSARGYRVVAAAAVGGVPPWSLPREKTAWLVGAEAHGLPADIIQTVDHLVTIPMPGGTESLNAAAAAAILAYETIRPVKADAARR